MRVGEQEREEALSVCVAKLGASYCYLTSFFSLSLLILSLYTAISLFLLYRFFFLPPPP